MTDLLFYCSTCGKRLGWLKFSSKGTRQSAPVGLAKITFLCKNCDETESFDESDGRPL